MGGSGRKLINLHDFRCFLSLFISEYLFACSIEGVVYAIFLNDAQNNSSGVKSGENVTFIVHKKLLQSLANELVN